MKKDGAAARRAALVENPDILATVGASRPRPAAARGRLRGGDGEGHRSTRKAKLARKGCDWIVANDVVAASRRHGRRQQHRASRDAPRRRDLADHEQGRRSLGALAQRIAESLKDSRWV